MKYSRLAEHIVIIVLTLAASVFPTCNNPTESTIPNLQLTAEYVNVTSVSIRVVLNQPHSTSTVTLKRDGSVLFIIKNAPGDTVVSDVSLLPKHHYLYSATLPSEAFGSVGGSSIDVTTMDTTSHNFSWEADTLGDGNSSNLRDITFVNDTIAYAVGEIYLKDSTGSFDPFPYNFLKWNGHTWTLGRIAVFYRGNRVIAPLYAIRVFAENDIWVTGGLPIHGDGTSWNLFHLYDMGVLASSDGDVERIWGAGSSDIFFGGPKGTVVHYDGSNWRKLASGTTLDIQDIYGTKFPSSSAAEILAVASQPFNNLNRQILRLTSLSVTALADSPISYSLSGVWFLPGHDYYVVGSGIYVKSRLTNSLWNNGPTDVTSYYLNAIRGSGVNNIFAVGAFGEIVHFNGTSWRSYQNATYLPSGTLHSLAVRGEAVIVVGELSPRAIIFRGRRI